MKKYLFVIIVLCVTVAQLQSLYSQNVKQTEYKILGLSVEGNKIAEAETILGLSGIYQGDKIKYPGDDKFQTAIRNLWKRGQFKEVRIVVDRVTVDGIFLKIIVKEFSRLHTVNIFGNNKLNDKEILATVSKTRGDIIKPYDLNLIEKKIKKLYFEEELQYAKVNATLITADSVLYSNLNIEIDEGEKFYAKQVQFIGNTHFENEELESVFDDTHTKKWWQFWRSAKFNPEKFEEDKKLLRDFYKKNGFINFAILSDSLIFDEKNGDVVVQVTVDEGEKYYLRNLTFNGNTIYNSQQFLNRIDMKSGDVMNVEKFEFNLLGNQDQTDALALYMDNGYLQASMTPNYKPVGDSMDIEVIVHENERYRYSKVGVTGNTKTREKVVRRELYTRPGDYFDRSAIINSIRALGVTGFFNPETLQPDIQPSKDEKNTVDVIYKVEERSSDQLNLQFGYSGAFGLTIQAGVVFNNFCASDPFVSGAGQTAQASIEIGNWDQYRVISLGLMEPWLFDRPTTVGANIFHTYYNYTNWKLARTGVGFNIGRRFRWPDNYFRGDWSWRTQYNDIKDAESNYYRAGQYWENTLTQSFTRTNWNHSFFPSFGSRFALTSSIALGAIGLGSTDFFKNEIEYSFVSPIWSYKGQDKVVLFVYSKLGYITGLKSDTAMSPVELYHMGGNGLGMFSVIPMRGYEDDVFGRFYDPQSGQITTGGKVAGKFTAELRFSISMDPMPIYVYGFAEAGNLWKDLRTANPSDLKRSAGVGIQLVIPQIGPIGFSYGYGFDPINVSGTIFNPDLKPFGWKFLFHLGGIGL